MKNNVRNTGTEVQQVVINFQVLSHFISAKYQIQKDLVFPHNSLINFFGGTTGLSQSKISMLLVLLFKFFFSFHFRAARVAYGSSGLGVELELQLLVYTTATAVWNPSRICDLHCSSQQCWIRNQLSEDRTRILPKTMSDP